MYVESDCGAKVFVRLGKGIKKMYVKMYVKYFGPAGVHKMYVGGAKVSKKNFFWHFFGPGGAIVFCLIYYGGAKLGKSRFWYVLLIDILYTRLSAIIASQNL